MRFSWVCLLQINKWIHGLQTLEHLSSSKEVYSTGPMYLSQILSSSVPSSKSSGHRKVASDNPLLIILSNCLHTRDAVLPSVMKMFASLTGDQETPPLLLVCRSHFKES